MGVRLPFKKKSKKKGLDWRSDANPRRMLPLRILVCLVCLAFLAVIPVFVNNAIGYVPVIAAVFSLLLSFIYVRIVAANLVFGGISNKGTCPRNTDAKYLVRFKNGTILPCTRLDAAFKVSNSYGSDDVVKRFSLSLGPKESKDFEYGVRFAHIGQVEMGLASVIVHDPLGLFVQELAAEAPSVIDVTPRIFPIDESIVKSLEFNESKESMTPFNKEGMDYMGVREYLLGDPMKTIHWKLSSRMETLYTRLFETSGNPGIEVLCDLHAADLSQESLMYIYDAIMELSLSLHRFGVTRSLRLDLLFYNNSGELVRFSESHVIDHRELIRLMPLPSTAHDEGEIPLLVQQLATDSFSSGNIMVCASDITDRLVTSLLEARDQGKRVALFQVIPENVEEQARKDALHSVNRLQDEGIRCFTFSSADELGEVTFE